MSNVGDNPARELMVRVTEDLTLSAGTVRQMVDDQGQSVAIIDPTSVPCFQQVVQYLESKPLPSEYFVRLVDEARVAAAVCLRWGSYFSVLADPDRPLSPTAQELEVSHINDDEMARMNIEISAAFAWWLTLKGSDQKRYAELVNRALTYLPLGRKTVTRSSSGDGVKACATREMSRDIKTAWPRERLERDWKVATTHGVRAIANTLTLLSFRNGPIEDVHAGVSAGYALNERRMLPRMERAIIRQAQDVLYAALQAMEYLVFDHAWPPPADRVLPFMIPVLHPDRWTYTEQSRVIRVPMTLNATA